jgi:hypothetical protein
MSHCSHPPGATLGALAKRLRKLDIPLPGKRPDGRRVALLFVITEDVGQDPRTTFGHSSFLGSCLGLDPVQGVLVGCRFEAGLVDE